jgi:hypothetical protein
MKTKAFQLEIPAEVGEQLHLTDQTAAKLIVRRGRLVVQFEESRLSIFEKGVLAWPVVMALIASIGYYFFCGWQQHNYVQLSGDYSLATSIILVGVMMGILLFAGFFIRDRNNPHNQFVNNIYW